MQQAIDALVDVARDLATAQCAELYVALGDRSPHRHAAAQRDVDQIEGAIEALRAALAQPDKPVASIIEGTEVDQDGALLAAREIDWHAEDIESLPVGTKLYAQLAPVAQPVDMREAFEAWARSHGGIDLQRAVDITQQTDGGWHFASYRSHTAEAAWRAWANRPAALAAPAPVAQPLTDEQILMIMNSTNTVFDPDMEEDAALESILLAAARAIERAHKIGGAA